MTTGLDKLIEAAASVDILKKELEIKEQEIKVATAKADEVNLLCTLFYDFVVQFYPLTKSSFFLDILTFKMNL